MVNKVYVDLTRHVHKKKAKAMPKFEKMKQKVVSCIEMHILPHHNNPEHLRVLLFLLASDGWSWSMKLF